MKFYKAELDYLEAMSGICSDLARDHKQDAKLTFAIVMLANGILMLQRKLQEQEPVKK